MMHDMQGHGMPCPCEYFINAYPLFFILFGMRWLATAFKSEAKASHSKAGVNACIKAFTMVR
jgi:hypothetical protein